MCYTKMAVVFFLIAFIVCANAQELDDSDEVMIAQESRHYQTVVKPPVRIVKPTGVTNSHRPQYNVDSLEDSEPTVGSVVKNYKSSAKLRAKEAAVREVMRVVERRDQAGLAQILPIIRAMSGSQRLALASLVASQVASPPGRPPLTFAQVRSMYANSNSTDLMLPILLDTANVVKQAKEKHPQLLRRSYEEDTDDLFEVGVLPAPTDTPKSRTRRIPIIRNTFTDKQNRNDTITRETNATDNANITLPLPTTEVAPPSKAYPGNISRSFSVDNSSLDLMADSTNQTLAQDLPVAEKLRALNRYIDRKGSLIRRGTYPPKPYPVPRRTTAEPPAPARRPPTPARKLPPAEANCELFTNTLCLHSDDYPTEAIVQSIRRNKAAAGALLADYSQAGDGVDGVSADQEAKYTAEHYLVSNRRGDTANRDFASAGEAGFMCPSTVKYARPQRARATSGHWKYIVNTGEHTQTLRLEKCLKPKEPCTYLTDNFKSKCVQVYNYHRLLTWDQQNGLHMDIFKVPTCCSCHIEGYSVSFPPLGHRIHETSSEHFPGEDLSSEQGNHAFENVQSTMQRPTITKPPFAQNKPEQFPQFGDINPNVIGSPFSKGKINEDNNQNAAVDSYGNNYYSDSFNQASSIRNVRRPLSARTPATEADQVTLPSYLEPPTPSASNSYSYVKEPTTKYKNTLNQYKRGTFRPSRRPIRKKISGPDDLTSSGSSAIETYTSGNLDSIEDFNEFADDTPVAQPNVGNVLPTKVRPTIGPKLHAVTTENSVAVTKETVIGNENFTSKGKRINYNYHPIIDFFDEDGQARDEYIDREDSESYVAPIESEWKPINHPNQKNSEASSLVGRKKT